MAGWATGTVVTALIDSSLTFAWAPIDAEAISASWAHDLRRPGNREDHRFSSKTVVRFRLTGPQGRWVLVFEAFRGRHPRLNRLDRLLGVIVGSLIGAAGFTRLVGQDLLNLPAAALVVCYAVCFATFAAVSSQALREQR